MTLVSGPLSTVTTEPSAVAQVNVSISSPRTRGAGVMTPEVKTVAVTGGVFSSQIAPGPAVLILLIGGRESAPIPILVDDVASQTLAEVVDAARLATGETQESLAQLVQQALTARTEVLDAVDDLVEEKGVALSAISGARGGALTDIGQATSSAITDIGTAESGALSAIGVEVGKAEDAADRAEDAATRAEDAVNDGVGDGSVTVAKLAQDVKDQINGKADLVGGKVPTSQIPEVALTKPFSVTSRAELLALDAQEGDIGIITAGVDKGSYVLGTGPANVFSSWIQLAVSADAPVTSVNGQTGTVVLNAADVGAAPETHEHTMAQITNLPTATHLLTPGTLAVREADSAAVRVGTPTQNYHAAPKSYVDQRVLKSGTATTLWSGTQAQYDALPTATRNAAGFIAVIV